MSKKGFASARLSLTFGKREAPQGDRRVYTWDRAVREVRATSDLVRSLLLQQRLRLTHSTGAHNDIPVLDSK